VRAKDGPAAEAAIVIVIAGDAVEEDVLVADQGATAGDIPAAAVVVDADGGKISSRFSVFSKPNGPQRCGPFILELQTGLVLERQAFENGFRDVPDAGHDIVPYFRSVEDVWRAAF